MTRGEYTESVLSALRHVTRREREAIRAEIDGHIEDHMADLLELDYPPELAEERTLFAMGDPKEVGRELNRQYPLRWLVIGRMAMAAVLVFALVAVGPVWDALRDTVLPNLQARWFPTVIWDLTETTFSDSAGRKGTLAEAAERTELRQTEDGVTAWLYQVGLEDPAAEETTAWFAVSFSSVNPFKNPNQYQWKGMRMEGNTETSEGTFYVANGFLFSGRVVHGQEVQVVCQRNGEISRFTVSLPWEEAAE